MNRLLIVAVCLMVSGCSALTTVFFYPQSVWVQTPDDMSYPYSDVYLTTADGVQIHGWWLPPESSTSNGSSPSTVVLHLHGNAENISTHFRSILWLVEQGAGVLTLDYRGFGASEGRALIPDVLHDVEAGVQWLQQQYPDASVWIVGQSIGAALTLTYAGRMASESVLAGVVVDAPFSGLGDVARYAVTQSWLGWVLWPWTWLLPQQWDAKQAIAKIRIPVLVIHSAEDKIIPREQGWQLYQLLQSPSCWLESRGPHIASFAFADVREATWQFIDAGICASAL
ncbi:MAG: alpha/beta fold hydrolase [Bacterioplanes sp.]|nr:alpha/beta fold hydrolase [Bacterioplanes sp.]